MSISSSPVLLGHNVRLFPANWRPATEEIAFAQRQGFAAIQFSDREQGLTEVKLGAAFAVVADALRDAGLVAALEIMGTIDPTGHTASGLTPLDLLHANMPAIMALPCSYVHLHLVPAVPMTDAQLTAVEAALVPQWAAGVALAQEHHFRFAFEHNEPLVGLYATPSQCAALLESVPGLGFVWDLNHTVPEHLAAFLAFTPRMTILHVSDTPLPTVNSHLPLGMGTIDFTAYCAEFLGRGFRGPAILEIGGLPQSGGYGRDTDAALSDSASRFSAALHAASAIMELSPGHKSDKGS